jgi:hypothetical protein
VHSLIVTHKLRRACVHEEHVTHAHVHTHSHRRTHNHTITHEHAHTQQYAKDALHPSHHGILATFLANGGGDGDKFKGANAALGLPGLSLMQEAVLRVNLRHWPMVGDLNVCKYAGLCGERGEGLKERGERRGLSVHKSCCLRMCFLVHLDNKVLRAWVVFWVVFYKLFTKRANWWHMSVPFFLSYHCPMQLDTLLELTLHTDIYQCISCMHAHTYTYTYIHIHTLPGCRGSGGPASRLPTPPSLGRHLSFSCDLGSVWILVR